MDHFSQFLHLKNGNYSTTLLVFLKEFQEMINVNTLAQCFMHGGHCECSINIAIFALFFSALCILSLLSCPSKNVLLMSASRSRGARSVELQICPRNDQSFYSFCDTSYSSLAQRLLVFSKDEKVLVFLKGLAMEGISSNSPEFKQSVRSFLTGHKLSLRFQPRQPYSLD